MKNLVAPEIEAYAEAHSIPESDACRRLREETCASVRDGVPVVRLNEAYRE